MSDLNLLFDIKKDNLANELIRGQYEGNTWAAFFACAMLKNRRLIGRESDLTACLHQEYRREEVRELYEYCYLHSTLDLATYGKTPRAYLEAELAKIKYGSSARETQDSPLLLLTFQVYLAIGVCIMSELPDAIRQIDEADVPAKLKPLLAAGWLSWHLDDFKNNDVIRTEIVKLAMAEKLVELQHLHQEREVLLRNSEFDAVVIRKLTDRIQQLEAETRS
ncbi:hypothetical protein [Ferrimonas balearica]|uniref:hypothetical protein n=1 Tax=Ferrimonas balearica TaxID=44012 RepID=UPI001C96225F|nr:hypothetical protein [Ferrimonas balearica]MBY6226647.1 hypothetical protein [Ferrimonas balearica]